MKKYLIWGAGKYTKSMLEAGYFNDGNLVALIDKNASSMYDCVGRKVLSPEDIPDIITDIDYILVISPHREIQESILKHANQLGIQNEMLLFAYNEISYLKLDKLQEQDDTRISECSPAFYSEIVAQRNWKERHKKLIYSNECDRLDTHSCLLNGQFGTDDYNIDYVRYRTFELCADEIKRHNIKGNTAEAGVFRGTFSRLIHASLPERWHYMYDSFKGFRPEDNSLAKMGGGRKALC